MATRNSPLCLRLSDDLHAAVIEMAEQQGVTTSEWMRDMLHRVVYNEPPGVEAGYMQGRQLGFRMLHLAFAETWKNLPTNVEDAMAMLQAGSPGRTPHDR